MTVESPKSDGPNTTPLWSALPQVGEEASAIFGTDHARRQIRKGPKKFTQEGHVVNYFTESIHFAPEAAFCLFPRELRSPLYGPIRAADISPIA